MQPTATTTDTPELSSYMYAIVGIGVFLVVATTAFVLIKKR
jgi:hypothetical protein